MNVAFWGGEVTIMDCIQGLRLLLHLPPSDEVILTDEILMVTFCSGC